MWAGFGCQIPTALPPLVVSAGSNGSGSPGTRGTIGGKVCGFPILSVGVPWAGVLFLKPCKLGRGPRVRVLFLGILGGG